MDLARVYPGAAPHERQDIPNPFLTGVHTGSDIEALLRYFSHDLVDP